MSNVDLSRVPAYYHKYILLAIGDDLETALKKHQTTLLEFLKEIPKKKWNHRYAEGKWSIKEVVQHVIDGERIFSYRALRFARKDQIPLASFDQDLFTRTSKAGERTKKDLLQELATVQRSSALLFKSFDEEQLDQPGIASEMPTYVKGLAYILVGHALHHMNVLKEFYLE